MKSTPYDAVILPGGGIQPDGSLADTAKARLEKAAELYKNGDVRTVIVCGAHSYKALQKPTATEAEVYASYLQSLGVPTGKIYLETESQETLGNFLFTKIHILLKHNWSHVLVIPSYGHSTDRVSYLLQKVLGPGYSWNILRVGENTDPANLAREAKSLQYTKEIQDVLADGDHQAIYKALMETHPAYGGTRWTVEELREQLGQQPKR